MTALPPIYYLHVWWARRPLVASRAAILASLLPADADQKKFLHAIGIHGDPVASRRRIDAAKRSGQRFEGEAYSYPRAFGHNPTPGDMLYIKEELSKAGRSKPVVLDPTAGGGSVPFESIRIGCSTIANDINPVAALIEKATIEFPSRFGLELSEEFRRIADIFTKKREDALTPYFPPEAEKDCITTNYIWARTISCPYCDGLVPLSPNWRLSPNGMGVRLRPNCESQPRICSFEIVTSISEHSAGTIADGDGTCPYNDCGRIIDGDEIKRQAQIGGMGEQLYAVVFKRRIATFTKAGKRGRDKWERGYRAPVASDDVSKLIKEFVDTKITEWEALDVVPSETIPIGTKTNEPTRYGMRKWTDMFSPRQLLGHATNAEIYRGIVADEEARGMSDLTRAALVYLALSLDKMLNYNSRMSIWMSIREVVANTFNRHDFAFCWSHAEMTPLIIGVGYDWAIEQTAKCIEELVELVGPSDDLVARAANKDELHFSVSCKSGDSLDHIADASVDLIVMDPPYYDNVMYAELSDYFYVWLKRTAGHIIPELFSRYLTDKESEAVANPAKFHGEKAAKSLAGRDYQERMARIFEECRRVLKSDAIMTLMFTHKATGAWDALTAGLVRLASQSLRLGRSTPRLKAHCTSKTSRPRIRQYS